MKHKLFSGTVTSVKKIVVEFMLPNVWAVVSGSTTNQSFDLSAQLRSNLFPIDSAVQVLKLLS